MWRASEFIRTSSGYTKLSSIFISVVIIIAVPLIIYKINQWLHDKGDPPWKTQEEREEREK